MDTNFLIGDFFYSLLHRYLAAVQLSVSGFKVCFFGDHIVHHYTYAEPTSIFICYQIFPQKAIRLIILFRAYEIQNN